MTGQPKVAAGFMSFTEITDPAEHRAYNQWHLFDHMPEQMPLPGIVSGERWVASPRCRATWRACAELIEPVHYVTLYLLAPPVAESIERFTGLAQELRHAGRFHEHRRAVLSGPLPVVAAAASPTAVVSAAAVPSRPNRGVHVQLVRQEGAPPPAQLGARVARVAATEGVAGVWVFAGPHADGALEMTVTWLDSDPVAVAPALPPAAAAPGGEVLLDGVLERVDPWGPFDWFDREAP